MRGGDAAAAAARRAPVEIYILLYMNLIFEIFKKFFYNDYYNIIILFVVCIIVNIIQTYGISKINANIINVIKEGSKKEVYSLFNNFILLSVVFLVFLYIYKSYQTKILTKLRQWMRKELVGAMLLSNNENFSDKNFIKMNSPINRISSMSYMISNDIITFLLPSLIFFVVIGVYFLYINFPLGAIFIVANIGIIAYLSMTAKVMIEKNTTFEDHANKNESYLLEILNNMDKIIYRGQTTNEISNFDNISDETTKKAFEFYNTTNFHGTVMNLFVYCVMFYFVYSIINMYFTKEINLVLFMTLFSIIILYRDRMSGFIQQIPDFVEFAGRTNGVLNQFDNILNPADLYKKNYRDVELPFDNIRLENVSFKYSASNKNVLDHVNRTINTTGNKIIGMTGLSGRGKSTFAKLLLKMYSKYTGDIYIDEVNIKEISADYIRKNVTYVNQNSKLFDKIVIDNILYGCNHTETCKNELDDIINNYPKISELFEGIDIYNKQSGSLGENLSGGQRQVIQIIGGIINPSKILILDEPTNALDIGLKRDILKVIDDYRKDKKCIIIITHDKDVFPLFDEKIEL